MSTIPIDSMTFRRALGHFPSGVVIVTTVVNDIPVGFAAQSFSSLSLDPPLIMFAPAQTSRTWPKIEQSGHFSVSVLSHDQRDISAIFGSKSEQKFANLHWNTSPQGNPIFPGCIVALDAVVENIYPGGDHHIVVGRVNWVSELCNNRPLLFYQGSYLTMDNFSEV